MQAVATVADWRTYPVTHAVADVTVEGDAARVRWTDGRSSAFHFVWLRDNCPCAHCVYPVTREQVFEVPDMPEDLLPRQVSLDARGGLQIAWEDGHASAFHVGWLRAHAYDAESRAERRRAVAPRQLWGAERNQSLPCFDFQEVMQDDSALHAWLLAVRDVGLCLLRGCPTELGTVGRAAKRISFIRESNFGLLFDVASKPKPDSNAYTSFNLPPHTDLPTRELQPGLQFLHCLVNGAVGGDSLFVDGFAVASALREHHADDFAVLSGTPVEFRNKEPHTDYRCTAPIIQLDPFGTIVEVRCANFLRAPFDVPAEQMPVLYRAYRRFTQLAREPRFCVSRRLQPGDMWVFDNCLLYTSPSPRD